MGFTGSMIVCHRVSVVAGAAWRRRRSSLGHCQVPPLSLPAPFGTPRKPLRLRPTPSSIAVLWHRPPGRVVVHVAGQPVERARVAAKRAGRRNRGGYGVWRLCQRRDAADAKFAGLHEGTGSAQLQQVRTCCAECARACALAWGSSLLTCCSGAFVWARAEICLAAGPLLG